MPPSCLLFCAVLAGAQYPHQTAPGRTHPVAAPKPLYDSTRTFTHDLPTGITHKAAMQAARTYGKIGAGQPLDRTDTLFLRRYDPAYLQVITPTRAGRRLRPTP